jgi:hypothetical protein
MLGNFQQESKSSKFILHKFSNISLPPFLPLPHNTSNIKAARAGLLREMGSVYGDIYLENEVKGQEK